MRNINVLVSHAGEVVVLTSIITQLDMGVGVG